MHNSCCLYREKKLVNELFEKISSSSSDVSGAVFIPEEPKDESMNIIKKEFSNLMI